ncbi:MAG: Stk1 family PASTA domain-containing Ser/Thr kinase [Eggerthellaceae bacterium]|nr:Stk1 family PASTA domain-containing Ser/Thr kinase [Eggerthellaceae bacterium]
MSDALIGRILNERYKLTERVGMGGMAEVWRATDIVLGRTVAVKVMLPQYAADEEFSDRFRQEAAAAANLSSPYIVNIYDWGQDQGTYYIVMEYVRGADLKSGLKQRGAISCRKAAEIGDEVCQALMVAHKQDIVHRDIKPQNIMIQPDGNIKVMDFGISHAKNSVKPTTESVLGTAHYISPEQAQGKELADTSDIYSLGVVLYECVTGRVPFDGPDAVSVAVKQVKEEPVPPSQVNPDVDEAMEAIILRAMAKEPNKRYKSAAAMREALQAYLAGTPIDGFGNVIAPDAAATMVIPANADMRGGAHAASHAHAGGSHASDYSGTGHSSGNSGSLYSSAGLTGTQILPASFAGASNSGPVTSAQAAARARIAARNHAANTGSLYATTDATGTIRRVSAHDPAYDGPRRGRLALIIILVLLLAAGLGLGLWYLGKDVVTAPDIVPSVVGKSQSEAAKIIKSAGFSVGETTKAYDDKVEAGYVISQSPAPNSKLEPGSAIDIVVSRGKELVTVPSLTGKTVTELQELLEQAGLVAKAGEATYSSTVATNLVISQDPVAGAKVEKGSTVTYILSLGIDYVTVPDVSGRTATEAGRILKSAGFIVFEQHEYSGTVDKDQVIRQSPAANSKLERGGGVTVVVSDGVELVEVPDVVGLTMKEATEKLLAAGLSVTKAGDTEDEAEVVSQTPKATKNKDDQVEKGAPVVITGELEITVTPDPDGE